MSENVITEAELKTPNFTPERLAELERFEKSLIRRREKHKAWYNANKDAIHEAYKTDGTKEKKKEYYQKNKDRIKTAAKARYAAMKAALDEANKTGHKSETKPETVGNIIAPSILDAFRGRGVHTKEKETPGTSDPPAQA